MNLTSSDYENYLLAIESYLLNMYDVQVVYGRGLKDAYYYNDFEITSDDLLWLDFKGKEIRIEQDRNFNDGKLMITVHKPNEDHYAKLLVEEVSDNE